MRILYVYHLNPEKISSQSGRPYSILNQLKNNGHDVTIHYTGGRLFRLIQYTAKLLHMIGISKGNSLRSYLIGAYSAFSINKRIGKDHYDLIFSPSTITFRNFHGNIGAKVVACADTLVPGLYKYYPNVVNDDDYISDIISESKCISNCDYLLVPTNWALKQLDELNLLKPPRTLVAPFGANITNELTRSEILSEISQRSMQSTINFVTICTDWIRKRGDLIAKLLNYIATSIPHKNISCHIIGSIDKSVHIDFNSSIELHFYGNLNKEKADDAEIFNRVMASSHYCCIPSGGEAFGMALCEALAFGIPIIGSRHGGISEIVNENFNGTYMDDASDIPKVAEFIISKLEKHELYLNMAINARNDYDNKFNWHSFYKATFEVIELENILLK